MENFKSGYQDTFSNTANHPVPIVPPQLYKYSVLKRTAQNTRDNWHLFGIGSY